MSFDGGDLDCGNGLLLLIRRKNIDDPVDRRDRAVGVQCREGQMAGLCDTQRLLHGLEISHLTDKHHIGILTKDGAKCVRKAVSVGVKLALAEE